MTLPAARDLSSVGVRVCTIAPGLVDTPLLGSLPEEARTALSAGIPFPKRLGRPDDFAELALDIVGTATSTARSSAWTARCAWHRAEHAAPDRTTRGNVLSTATSPIVVAYESVWTPDWPLDAAAAPSARTAAAPATRRCASPTTGSGGRRRRPTARRRCGSRVVGGRRCASRRGARARSGPARRCPSWLGAADRPEGFDPAGHPVVADLHRAHAVAAAGPHRPHVGRARPRRPGAEGDRRRGATGSGASCCGWPGSRRPVRRRTACGCRRRRSGCST